jgi:REP element-mobilizing transposase RayT
MESNPLTPKQELILRIVQDFLALHGFPPTLKEIGDTVGIVNINAVRGHLLALERKGYITKAPERARSIQILRSPSPASRIKRRMHEILKSDEGVIHRVIYGLAWATHKRKPLLKGLAGVWMAEVLEQEASERGWEILQKKIESDHMSLVVKVWPNHSPLVVLRRCQNAAMRLRRKRPDFLPGKRVWSRGYVVTTSIERLDSMVRELIQSQDIKS